MNKLRFLRRREGVTLRELGEYTYIHYNVLSRLENDGQEFKEEYIRILTKHFNVSADYLLGYVEEEKQQDQIVRSKLEKILAKYNIELDLMADVELDTISKFIKVYLSKYKI